MTCLLRCKARSPRDKKRPGGFPQYIVKYYPTLIGKIGIYACTIKKQETANKKHSTIIVYSHLLKNGQWEYNAPILTDMVNMEDIRNNKFF